MYAQRPIYWPLSSARRTVVAWVSIHHLDAHTFPLLLERLQAIRSRCEALALSGDEQPTHLHDVVAELSAFMTLIQQCRYPPSRIILNAKLSYISDIAPRMTTESRTLKRVTLRLASAHVTAYQHHRYPTHVCLKFSIRKTARGSRTNDGQTLGDTTNSLQARAEDLGNSLHGDGSETMMSAKLQVALRSVRCFVFGGD